MFEKGTREMTTFTTQDRQDAQRTPLTEEAIYKIYDETYDRVGASEVQLYFPIEIARAIERAHGIGE